jgi:hypothetical protein
MNRNRLRLYSPPEEPSMPAEELTDMDSPHILRFRSRREATVISGRYTPPADRARMIRDNCVCPECQRSDVEPLELEDGLVSQRNHQPIPGTATIVGFHCNDCGSEWPVYELTARQNC